MSERERKRRRGARELWHVVAAAAALACSLARLRARSKRELLLPLASSPSAAGFHHTLCTYTLYHVGARERCAAQRCRFFEDVAVAADGGDILEFLSLVARLLTLVTGCVDRRGIYELRNRWFEGYVLRNFGERDGRVSIGYRIDV